MLYSFLRKSIYILFFAVVATIFTAPSVAAKGETYAWGDRNHTFIQGSGGWFSSTNTDNIEIPSRFTLVEYDENNEIGTYENAEWNSTGVCYIQLQEQGGDIVVTPSYCYTSGGSDNRDLFDQLVGGDTVIAGFTFGEAPLGEYVDTQMDTVRDTAARDALYDSFNGALKDLMYAYYQSLTNPPCSSQGCNEIPWRDMVYSCWTKARSDAASAARYSQDPNYDVAGATKRFFAQCLAGKSNGTFTQVDVEGVIKDVSVGDLNKAYSDAADDAEQQLIIERCEQDGGVWNEDGGICDYPTVDTDANGSCAIQGLGWIICPIMNFMGGALDASFNFLADDLLSTDVNNVTNDQTRAAWEVMRNFANVAFVIAFLIIIYSQITGAGVSNYGVKKLLPRLVITAILVNVSFYLCLIAVDISNILGYSLKDVFESLGGLVQVGDSINGSDSGSALGVAGIVGAVLIGAGGVVTVALAASGPVILAALLAILMIVFMLVGRIALIILLTVISPLAFVAYLLPNTEQWFRKWYKMYFALLMLFPIVSVVFGASSLAAKIIWDVATPSSGSPDLVMQVIALGVATVPFFVVPGLLKGALSSTGTLGAKLSGMSSRLNGRVGGKVKSSSRLGEAYKNRQYRSQMARANARAGNGRTARFGRFVARKAGDDTVLGKAGLGVAAVGSAGNTFDNSKVGKFLGTDKGATAAEAAIDAEFEKSVKDTEANYRKSYAGNNAALVAIANDSKASEEHRMAARRIVMSSGSHDEKKQALMSIGARSSVREKAEMNQQYYASGMSKYFGNKFGAQAFSANSTGVGGEAGLQRAMIDNFGEMEAETLGKSGAAAMKDVANAVAAASPEERARLEHVTQSVLDNKDLRPQTAEAQAHFDSILGNLTNPSSGSVDIPH